MNEDDDTALLRIINTPSRKIGPKVVEGLRIIANERNCSLIRAMRLLEAHVNSGNVDKTLFSLYKKISVFYELFKALNEKRQNMSLSAFADEMLRMTGLYKYYQEKDFKDGKDTEEHSRYANLGMLISNIKEFEAAPPVEDDSSEENTSEAESATEKEKKLEDPLLTYLSNITLVSTGELNEEGGTSNVADAVNLMTMHASKGLEFKYVFLVGFEKDILPSRLCAYSDKSLAEERRLAYVGVTRAKKALFISYAQVRSMFGNLEPTGASSFLRDLVREYKGKQEVPLMIEAVKGYSFY